MNKGSTTPELPSMPREIAESAEARIWLHLRAMPPSNVNHIADDTGYTPQYTRKTLRGLERAGLADLDVSISPNLWSACGALGGVIRHAKTRDLVAVCRVRRATCIRIWRLLKRSSTPITVASISTHLQLDAATTQSALRLMRAKSIIQSTDQNYAETGSRSRALSSSASLEALLTSLQDIDPPVTRPQPPAFPRVNSVWALGSLGLG